MTLKPKMTYFRQQETSLVSRILLRLLCPGWFGSREGILSCHCTVLYLLHIIAFIPHRSLVEVNQAILA